MGLCKSCTCSHIPALWSCSITIIIVVDNNNNNNNINNTYQKLLIFVLILFKVINKSLSKTCKLFICIEFYYHGNGGKIHTLEPKIQAKGYMKSIKFATNSVHAKFCYSTQLKGVLIKVVQKLNFHDFHGYLIPSFIIATPNTRVLSRNIHQSILASTMLHS